jgi:hypothetical protein
MKSAEPEFIESMAGEVAEELARRRIAPGRRVLIAVEPAGRGDWLEQARSFARAKVVAEGWTDDDIDRIIKEERKAVQSQIG